MLLTMVADDVAEVEVGEGVAADEDERLVQVLFGVLDAAGGPEGHFLARVGNANAKLASVAEVVFDGARHVLDGDDDIADAVRFEEVEDVLHHRAPDDGHHRLGAGHRQGAQAGALASRHHDCLHRTDLPSSSARVTARGALTPRPPRPRAREPYRAKREEWSAVRNPGRNGCGI